MTSIRPQCPYQIKIILGGCEGSQVFSRLFCTMASSAGCFSLLSVDLLKFLVSLFLGLLWGPPLFLDPPISLSGLLVHKFTELFRTIGLPPGLHQRGCGLAFFPRRFTSQRRPIPSSLARPGGLSHAHHLSRCILILRRRCGLQPIRGTLCGPCCSRSSCRSWMAFILLLCIWSFLVPSGPFLCPARVLPVLPFTVWLGSGSLSFCHLHLRLYSLTIFSEALPWLGHCERIPPRFWRKECTPNSSMWSAVPTWSIRKERPLELLSVRKVHLHSELLRRPDCSQEKNLQCPPLLCQKFRN